MDINTDPDCNRTTDPFMGPVNTTASGDRAGHSHSPPPVQPLYIAGEEPTLLLLVSHLSTTCLVILAVL